jgi:hypothetical protein
MTNHLAPYQLNKLLEPVLPASTSRVVQVSAGLYVKAQVDPDRTPEGLDFHLRKEQPLGPEATDKDLARRLWDQAATYTGVD